MTIQSLLCLVLPPPRADATECLCRRSQRKQRRGFSSNRKGIDNSPVWRYCSGQKKRWFKFPIRIKLGLKSPTGVLPRLGQAVRTFRCWKGLAQALCDELVDECSCPKRYPRRAQSRSFYRIGVTIRKKWSIEHTRR
jgi:hypothetical protein